MRDSVELNGVILKSQPIGEYDRRLVILTRERGRITAFARGVRRPKSALIAVTNPFVFASFTLYEGRDAYTLANAAPVNFFEDLSQRMPGVLYGSYFLELSDYFGRENLPAEDAVNLLYTALRAVLKEQMPPELVRRVFEIRTLVDNGEYAPPADPGMLDKAAWYALRYAAVSPYEKLFGFSLSEEAEKSFAKEVNTAMSRTVDRDFKSLEVLAKMRYNQA